MSARFSRRAASTPLRPLKPLAPLIIDEHVAEVRDALARRRAVVLSASPGAGKTTRIPPALIDAGPLILLQPRRVAARAVARRIADEREWTLGREVGWHIRFEKRATRDTRLLVVTEGILTARLQQDPLLSDFSTVVLDEFHERSVHADLGLALARQAWLARTDLRIVVMSATLDVQPVARFLDDAPVVSVPGALYPLTIEYADGESIAEAARAVLSRTAGQVLCFLPGAREIERASSDLSSILASGSASGIAVVPLHGSLDGDAQDAAISPSEVRRIILATNIAETSLTVPGVSAVIDTGQVKVARYDADRGVDSLTLERITSDSAEQRAGRAARLGPGLVRRLWDARDRLRPHREPEIARVDLAGPVLDLLAWGADPLSFDWFEAPSTDRIRAALRLLCRLGAADGDDAGARITDAREDIAARAPPSAARAHPYRRSRRARGRRSVREIVTGCNGCNGCDGCDGCDGRSDGASGRPRAATCRAWCARRRCRGACRRRHAAPCALRRLRRSAREAAARLARSIPSCDRSRRGARPRGRCCRCGVHRRARRRRRMPATASANREFGPPARSTAAGYSRHEPTSSIDLILEAAAFAPRASNATTPSRSAKHPSRPIP